jgi:dipeptidyl aminopeptidase/acylaminoacyl peptidase
MPIVSETRSTLCEMDFNHYLNIRAASTPSLRADGKRLAFSYNGSGTMQIHTLDAPQAWPQQRTFYPNRVRGLEYAPVGNRYVFGMDEGGDEKEQLYLSSDDGREVIALTDQPSVKHFWGCWNEDGSHIAFTATRDHPTDFDVYTMDLVTKEIRKVSSLGGYCYVRAWRGNTLLVSQATENTNNNLYTVNLETGEQRLLTPHDGKALFRGNGWSADGRYLILSSNLEREFINLARLDLKTLRLEFLSERPWDEEALQVTRDGRTGLILSNEAGLSVLELMDLETLQKRVVEGLPHGVAEIGLSADGQTFLVTVTSPSSAANVYSLDAADVTLTRWTDVTLGLIPDDALVEPELVSWKSFDDLEITGWYCKPRSASGKLPVVINIHGGPERQSRPSFAALSQYLVARGFAVLFPNVRGGYGKTFMALDDVEKRMDSVADIKAAVEWLVAHGNANPKRIAVYGGSYGGFMVLSCLTTYPELFAAGVDIVGPSSLVTFLKNTSAYRRKVREAEYGSLEHDLEFLERISPINHIEKLRAPLFIVHGANDPRTPLGEAQQVHDALHSRGSPVELLVYHDEGHGLAKLSNRLDAYPKIVAFLEQHLNVQ